VCLTSRQRKANRKAIRIDHCMNLAGQPAARPAHGLTPIAADTSGVLILENGEVFGSGRTTRHFNTKACRRVNRKSFAGDGE
jgi:hypothetical protein